MNRIYRREAGYSLIEMMVVVGLLGVLSSIAVVQMGNNVPAAKGDGAMRLVLSQMVQARETAIAQRRNMRLTFTNTNQVQIIREEVPGPTLTTVSSTLMEGGLQFVLVSGPGDTPDHFGNSPLAAVSFGTATEVKFNPQGQLVDQNGAFLNGTVFVAIPGRKPSVRAVTVMGSTGRVRGWRWNGSTWVKV